MFMVSMLKWWYSAGWRQRVDALGVRLGSALDYFSPGLLIRTLFSLFRQDGADQVEGSLEVKFQAMIGRLISRCIGAMVRSAVLVVGLVWITILAATGAAWLLLWPLVPIAPVAGVVLFMMGVVPWHL